MSSPAYFSRLCQKLFSPDLPTPEELALRYPARSLPAGAEVTRFAPSPTGFMHIGGVFTSLISERLAHQSGGIFYLRIEDTDRKRETDGAAELVVRALERYKLRTDEGMGYSGTEVGAYGPYKQSARERIYQTYLRRWLEQGIAYPCFCTMEQLEEARTLQEVQKMRTGYYGPWALCRKRTEDEVSALLDANTPFVLRFKSPGVFEQKIAFEDVVRGKRELSENDQDVVLMKSDGLPTYHFAHIVDDHLMGTTLVTRSDEWLSSVPLHLQLFAAMGWQPPRYAHLSPIQKMEGTAKRKLSKRKDPEASVTYFEEQGYPSESVTEYLLNLANSNFEDWRKANPTLPHTEFVLSLDKVQAAGALFDFVKLDAISKEVVARFSAQEVFACACEWATIYDPELLALLQRDPAYVCQILGIERGIEGNTRKDIAKWSGIRSEISYFFDDQFSLTADEAFTLLSDITQDDVRAIASAFLSAYDPTDSKERWLEKVRTLSIEHGFAENGKAFKLEPTRYKGSIAHVTKIFRVLLSGRSQTPDLHAIMQVMGKERVLHRLALVS
ncbi:glutamate--tRNA ligase [Patescibacteria group bacterium]|nr:glutamate--tRNA ligase [Patescibacteria group bacterium]